MPLCVPELRGNEWKYLQACLETNWVSSAGPFVEQFECAVANYVGAQYGVAVVNGTSALHLALIVSGVEPDDEVLLPALSFIAPANAVRYCGAWPVFIDIEPTYWQIDPEQVADFLERQCVWRNGILRNSSSGRRVRAILPVDILGHPVDMDAILALARKYDLVVIEDATESLGGVYRGRSAGSLADIGCLSFNGNKLITTGAGGMLVTDNEEWADRARYLSTQAKKDPVEYVHGDVGYNYRLSNLHAAVGCAQMERIEDYVAAKRRIAASYTTALATVPGVESMREAPWASSVFWMFTVTVDETRFGMDSRSLLRGLASAGIQSRPLWQPLHLSPAFPSASSRARETAEALYRTALSLPCSVGLRADEMERVLDAIFDLHAKTR